MKLSRSVIVLNALAARSLAAADGIAGIQTQQVLDAIGQLVHL